MAGGSGVSDMFNAFGGSISDLASSLFGGTGGGPGGGGGGPGIDTTSPDTGSGENVLTDPLVGSQAAVTGETFPGQQQQQPQQPPQPPEQTFAQQQPAPQAPAQPNPNVSGPGWFNPTPTAQQQQPGFQPTTDATQAPAAQPAPAAPAAAPTEEAATPAAPEQAAQDPLDIRSPEQKQGEAQQQQQAKQKTPLQRVASALKNIGGQPGQPPPQIQLPPQLTGADLSPVGPVPQPTQTPSAASAFAPATDALSKMLFGGPSAFRQDLMSLANQGGAPYGQREYTSRDFNPPTEQRPAGQQPAAQQPANAPGPISSTGASLTNPPQQQPDGTQIPTNGLPGGTVPNAPPPAPNYGANRQANAQRPYFYRNKLDINGKQFDFGTGGQQFASLPYGTYHVHPGAIGGIGRRIGAIAGISDSSDPGDNTVHDPNYRGAGGTNARAGVEIHPDVSGGRLTTNGCIGIAANQWGAFGREFNIAKARGPLTLTIGPNGASITSPGETPRTQVASLSQDITRSPVSPPGGSALTRGERNNNPGNIKRGPFSARHGATGYDRQNHAQFPNFEAGAKAHADLLRTMHRGKTIPQMNRRGDNSAYAEGNPEWTRNVMRFGGYGPNDIPDLDSPEGMERLQRAIWRQEGVRPPSERDGRRAPPSRFQAPEVPGNYAEAR
jgi:hypothetical protein